MLGFRGMGCTCVVKRGCANYALIATTESREEEEVRRECPSKINPQRFTPPRTIGPRNPTLSQNPHLPEIFPAGSLNYEFSQPLEFGQFGTSRLFSSGAASFLGEFLDLVSFHHEDVIRV